MTDQVIVVDDQLSWARRVGDDVDVRLRLPDAPLEPGTTDVELVTSSKRLRSVADATLEDGVATVAFRVRQSELGPDTWSLEVRTTSHGSFVPLRARLAGGARVSGRLAARPGAGHPDAPTEASWPPIAAAPAGRTTAGTGPEPGAAHAGMGGRGPRASDPMTAERPRGRTRGWLRRVRPARAGDRLPKLPMERLGKQGRRDVVILADPAHPDALRRWLHEFATDRVSVVTGRCTPATSGRSRRAWRDSTARTSS